MEAAFLILAAAALAHPSPSMAVHLSGEPDPSEGKVMVSERVSGIKLACFLNETGPSSSSDYADKEAEGEKKDEDPVITWKHDGLEIDSDEYVKVDKDTGHSKLRIQDHEEATYRVGRISCHADGHEPLEWQIEPHFKVEPMHKSEYVTEGEDAYLHCIVRDISEPGEVQFFWYRMHEHNSSLLRDELPTPEISDKGEPHTQVLKPNDTERGSTLKIENVRRNDRDFYKCLAVLMRTDGEMESNLTSETMTLVRVKDKYSALYPFIGIVAEVIVLVTIIFICERRKSGQDAADDDDDDKGSGGAGGGGGGTGPSNGSSNIRHRRT